jgi:hypothetical protein
MATVAFHEPAPGILSWVHPDPAFMQRAGHAVRADGGVWVIDPPDGDEVLDRIRDLGKPAGVIQALDRHPRDCESVADALGVPLHHTPFDGVTGAPFRIIGLWRLPIWKETALWFGRQRTLYVPEALAAAPMFIAPGEAVGVHPARRLIPPQRLRDVIPEHLLMGHGAPVSGDAAREGILDALDHSRRRFPALLARTVRDLPKLR